MDSKRSTIRTLVSSLGILASTLAWGQGFVADEVLVRFHPGHELAAAAAEAVLGASQVQWLAEIQVRRLKLPRGVTVENALRRYRSLPFVEYAEPNYLVRAHVTPDDPEFGPKQSHLRKIRSEQGWDLSSGNPDIIIAIIDTGVDLDHPDLVDKLVPGYDVENDDPNPDDDNGHGSHVAGLAAAATNNALGIAGVGWGCRIMPVKALDSSGNGSSSTIAAAINYAANNGANVISMSLGTKNSSSTMRLAVLNAISRNAVVVASAGNDGNQQPVYPAYYPESIAVAASTETDAKASFSNHGPWVDVAAPGVNVYSCYRNGGYRYISGTSMAAPMVSGLAGLLWSKFGTSLSNLEIRALIEDNAIPVGTFVQKGRIDVERALLNLGTVEEVRRFAAPVDSGVETGSVVSGSHTSLLDSDDQRLELAAARFPSGRSASLWASGSPEWSGQRLALEASVEFSTSPTGLVQLSFWNWMTQTWNIQKTISASESDRVHVASSNRPDLYVGPKNEIRVRVSRSEGRNRLFRLRTDRVLFSSVSLE